MSSATCKWCGEIFPNHGKLIIHSQIIESIPRCSLNPYVNKKELDYQKGYKK